MPARPRWLDCRHDKSHWRQGKQHGRGISLTQRARCLARDAARLSLKTDAETDFWQETFYGFHRDSGHAYLAPISGDFTVRSVFRAADAP
ncbi:MULTISPECIES: DUF1349 domain-containing protein [unclassified Rhizobium]|uniref:DUF1349 domain-containing protein n=1 Tax=unclassified Rhizobium TaxID=2613769 RepID=UPI001FCD1E91|nr:MULTISPECIES: DUF1349 domain-containing protein [unclassified Rhizobium]